MRQHMIAGSGRKLMALLLCTEGRGNLRGTAIRVVVWCITMIARLPNIYNGCGADFFLARPMYALVVPITEEIANACCVTTSQLRHALAGAAGVPDWRHGSDYCAALLCVPAHRLALADRPDVHCRDIAAHPA